jgi:hypothetical protein
MKQFVTVAYDIVCAGGVHRRPEKVKPGKGRPWPLVRTPRQQVLIGVNDSRPTAA